MYGLYLHIPFCVRKCLYCDFYSLPTGTGPLPGRAAPDQARFLDALEAELARLPAGFAPATLFIGGGTPTELSDADFDRLLDMIPRHADLRGVVEWTCEANPGTLTRAKLDRMKEAGVNRVSLGVQSFDAVNLEFLNRIHTAGEAEAGFHLLREAGFDNINLDFIFAIPGSRLSTHLADAHRAIALGPEHLSFYSLIFEEGTPLLELKRRGFVSEVDDEEQRAQQEALRDALTAAGYCHYEISNYARPVRACRHNLLYWGAGEYIGCGPSAHSHWRGRRYGNVRDLHRYVEALLNGRSACDFEEHLDPEAKARETLVMSLRRLDGLSRSRFRSDTGFDVADLCGDQLERFRQLGLLEMSGDCLRLTEEGVFVSNALFAEMV
jgi:oxygen-independent coproporphyrinogen-3 oxidase